MMYKRQLGQFYTYGNPFGLLSFARWFSSIPAEKRSTVLEPFAGAANIPELLYQIGFDDITWVCYDINPVNDPEINTSGINVMQKDTIQSFPQGFSTIITNPPYLAKNSAKRKGLSFPAIASKYSDLYLYCIDIMLSNAEYVAAIIPESFITTPLFKERLVMVDSLLMRMFDDTECPVCLAMFDNKEHDDFAVYQNGEFVGTYKEFTEVLNILFTKQIELPLKFNDIRGQIGLYAVDSIHTKSIRFVKGQDIDDSIIKPSCRSITKIYSPILDGRPTEVINNIIERSNIILDYIREKSKDVFLTSFKGLRQDGRYRRRLSFALARKIVNLSIYETCYQS